MYITIYETDHHFKFNALNRALKASALGQPEGCGGEGGRRGVHDEGTHVHPWLIHVDVWQNQYNIVK